MATVVFVSQRNKELEECIEAQKRQIKELEEKVIMSNTTKSGGDEHFTTL